MYNTVKIETGDMPNREHMTQLLLVGMRAFPTFWHALFKAQHFSASAPGRYGYAPRKPNYVKRKLRRFKHALPLVWAGKGRAAAMGSQKIEASTQVTSAIVSGRVWNLSQLPRSQVNLRAEVTAVTDAENSELDRMAQLKVDAADRRMQRRA